MEMTPHEPRSGSYCFGTAKVSPATSELRVEGGLVHIEDKPFEVLLKLLAHPGEVVTRQQLHDSIWEGRTGESVVDTALTKLRTALGPNAQHIKTKRGKGYYIVGVEWVEDPVQEPVVVLDVGAPVPGRPEFVLVERLSQPPHCELWRVEHRTTGQRRRYKFSLDDDGLAALERDVRIAQCAPLDHRGRCDFAPVLNENFVAPPFFLEFEDKDSLAEWAAEHDLPGTHDVPARLALFLRIADAVAVLHAFGMLHTDLQPANVLVDANRQLLFSDCGSLYLLDPEYLKHLGVTQGSFSATTVAGPRYHLAPELLAGQPPTVRSDIYALGVMLYQILTGDLDQPLVPGWEQRISDLVMSAHVARATEVDPDFRFSSVEEFVHRLRVIYNNSRRGKQRRQIVFAVDADMNRLIYLPEHIRRPWLAAATSVLSRGKRAAAWLRTWLSTIGKKGWGRNGERVRRRAEGR